ncbi:MAG TPA: hypothetical protein VM819_17670 [Vicinamibacterales bacterium]|nr:hypothetical protein [Vicinamibacterales bacterium]
MEPLNDDELKHAVSSWKAPTTPDHLRNRIFGARQPWWRWVLTGSVRVPVPVCAALALFLAWFAWQQRSLPDIVPPASDRQGEVTLADFRPDTEVQARVVGALR